MRTTILILLLAASCSVFGQEIRIQIGETKQLKDRSESNSQTNSNRALLGVDFNRETIGFKAGFVDYKGDATYIFYKRYGFTLDEILLGADLKSNAFGVGKGFIFKDSNLFISGGLGVQVVKVSAYTNIYNYSIEATDSSVNIALEFGMGLVLNDKITLGLNGSNASSRYITIGVNILID